MQRLRGTFFGIGMAIAVSAGACSVVSGLDQYSASSSKVCTGAGCQKGGLPDAADSMGNVSEDATVMETGGDDMSSDMSAPVDGEPSDDGGISGDAGDGAGDAGSTEGGSGDGGGGGMDGGDAGSCVCVDTTPSGWTGYVQLVLSDAGAAACAPPYGMMARTTKTNPTGAPAPCTACSCAPPSGFPITCQVQLGSAGIACAGETLTPAPQNTCVIPPLRMGLVGPNGDSYGPTMVPAPVTPCTPAGGQLAQAPAAPSATSVSVCTLTDVGPSLGSCASSNQVCLPVPQGAPGSPSGQCIYQSGVQTCPSGSYSKRFVTSDFLNDTRGCGVTCACAAPACPTDGYVAGYTSLDCSGNSAATFSATTSCALGNTANSSASFKYFPSQRTWSGTCGATTAGGPNGGVAVDSTRATTFCCPP